MIGLPIAFAQGGDLQAKGIVGIFLDNKGWIKVYCKVIKPYFGISTFIGYEYIDVTILIGEVFQIIVGLLSGQTKD